MQCANWRTHTEIWLHCSFHPSLSRSSLLYVRCSFWTRLWFQIEFACNIFISKWHIEKSSMFELLFLRSSIPNSLFVLLFVSLYSSASSVASFHWCIIIHISSARWMKKYNGRNWIVCFHVDFRFLLLMCVCVWQVHAILSIYLLFFGGWFFHSISFWCI